MQSEQGSFELKNERIDNKYFRLAASLYTSEDSVVVADIKVDAGKVKPADTIKPSCSSLKLSPSEFQMWEAKARVWVQQSSFLAAEINV